MIEDAFTPPAAELRIFGSCEDGRVLDRDSALVVVAIEGPGLQLAAGERALVHPKMKRVLVVITLLADGIEAGDES